MQKTETFSRGHMTAGTAWCGIWMSKGKEKITEYIAAFNKQLTASDESKAKPEDSMNG